MRHVLGIAAAAALLSLGGGYDDRRYRPRELTLDEEEERSVQRMLNRARARRRAAERERIRVALATEAQLAAEREAARPKSRQELRAKERAARKASGRETPPTRFSRVVGKEKSSSLERMLGRKKRGSS